MQSQREWNPGLANGHRLLGDEYQQMPGDPQSHIPWLVKLLENPHSPLALAGSIDLLGHDCLHILLGRGLLPRDEAFVLGYTMGTSARYSEPQRWFFSVCAQTLYRGDYRFSEVDARVFDFAVTAARASGARGLDRVNYQANFGRSVGEVRRELGLDVEHLRKLYFIEPMNSGQA